MSPAMDYKGATGIRARGDLTANALNTEPPKALAFEEIVAVARSLQGMATNAVAQGQRGITLYLPGVHRLVDALLLAAGRPGEAR